MLKQTKRIVILLSLSSVFGGCASIEIEPWVKPYERSHLADPIMSKSRNPVSASFMKHVLEGREGARGAEGGAGGGCGCN